MGVLQTEYTFVLPKGYVDESGTLHREGKMRLATASDEILPMKDPRVQQNAAYLSVILLSRVIVDLGSLKGISTQVIEGLFSADFSYLQDMYNRINQNGTDQVNAQCPKCEHTFEMEMQNWGD